VDSLKKCKEEADLQRRKGSQVPDFSVLDWSTEARGAGGKVRYDTRNPCARRDWGMAVYSP